MKMLKGWSSIATAQAAVGQDRQHRQTAVGQDRPHRQLGDRTDSTDREHRQLWDRTEVNPDLLVAAGGADGFLDFLLGKKMIKC